MILVTGFEPFGPHADNPSREIAKSVDGRRVGGQDVLGSVLPVRHAMTRSPQKPRVIPRAYCRPGAPMTPPRAGTVVLPASAGVA